MAHLDHTIYFDEMRGGSRNSGFIQRMLAERPEDFELDAIGSPSMWLQMHYPLYGNEKNKEDNWDTLTLDEKIKKDLKRTRAEQEADIVHVTLSNGRAWSYSKSKLKKLEDEIQNAEKEYKDYFKEKQDIESNKTTQKLKREGLLTKKEAEELEDIEKTVRGKRILTTDPLAKEYNKKIKDFEKRASEGMIERTRKMRSLQKRLSDLVENKMLMTGEVKAEDKGPVSFDITDKFLNAFARQGSPKQKEEIKKIEKSSEKAVDLIDKKPDWRAEAGYKDTVWNGNFATNAFNRNSQLPKEYEPDDGWDWLASKYGKLYDTAVSKTKEIVRKGRPDLSSKEYKEFIRLPFNNTEQMKDFFRDVLLADPILYNHLHINAHSTKAPSTEKALREFKKWKD